jgi:phenylacetate-CoA ligase
VFNDFIIAELVPREDGLWRVVLTDLTNFTMPFIRYDQGDLAEPVESPCPCGRNFPQLRLLGARSSDLVRLPNGGTVSALRVGIPLNGVPGVDRFQIVQESLTRIVARVVRQPGCDQLALERAVAEMTSQLPGLRVELEIVSHLPPNPSGKFSQFRSSLPATST